MKIRGKKKSEAQPQHPRKKYIIGNKIKYFFSVNYDSFSSLIDSRKEKRRRLGEIMT